MQCHGTPCLQSTEVTISMGIPVPALLSQPDGDKTSLVAPGDSLGLASPGSLWSLLWLCPGWSLFCLVTTWGCFTFCAREAKISFRGSHRLQVRNTTNPPGSWTWFPCSLGFAVQAKLRQSIPQQSPPDSLICRGYWSK